MRLADFILANVEPILAEWEDFARSIWPADSDDSSSDPAVLRDDAGDILRATASDMQSEQSSAQQSAKSKGKGPTSRNSNRVDQASLLHGTARGSSGFELWALVAEYRALRASVLRLWRESSPSFDLRDIADVTRFNECIDQSLAESVTSYTEQVQSERARLLRNEQAARQDAEGANRAKDMFLATLSHELRTPLSAIMGWTNILRMTACTKENIAEGIEVIERNAKVQLQLIEDVLDVSRIVSGKMRLEIRDCDLIGAVSAGIDSVRPTADARGTRLEVQLDPAASRASCDASRIQQVVWNLLSNAIKFTQKGGVVRIALQRESSGICISVSDNGPGISPELLTCVFEPFKQADSSLKRKYGGLGLGLSIVKHLAEMHGGTVEAMSDGEGHGATFNFRMPIRAVQISQADADGSPMKFDEQAEPSQSPVRLDGLHVLVVDDEADARRMLLKVLEEVGAFVTTASGVDQALALVARASAIGELPDVVVSDIGMPDRDGHDLIRELRQLGHTDEQLPAVALTAFANNHAAREAEAAGFQVHISKPADLYKLTSTISDLAGQKVQVGRRKV